MGFSPGSTGLNYFLLDKAPEAARLWEFFDTESGSRQGCCEERDFGNH